jgi:exo-1,4-beta-D-glucosaminidase
LTALQALPSASSDVRATLRHEAGGDLVSVTLTVPASSQAVALFEHLSIRQTAGGENLLPILWSGNDVTLWPGESLTVTAHLASPVTQMPVVDVSGWNVPTKSVPVVLESRTAIQ